MHKAVSGWWQWRGANRVSGACRQSLGSWKLRRSWQALMAAARLATWTELSRCVRLLQAPSGTTSTSSLKGGPIHGG